MLPQGTDDLADAPAIGFGITAPTPNAALHPVDDTEAIAIDEPTSDNFGHRPYQTAWWRFVAPKSGWVCIDTHRSTTNFDIYNGNDFVPWTTLGVYIGEPGNLWPIAACADSIPLGGEVAVWDPEWGWGHTEVNTSEVLLMVDEGLTYYVQVGSDNDTMVWAPQAVIDYVVTIREVICTPTEIVLGSRGAHDSPAGLTSGAVPPIIVGDPDTCLDPDTAGYIEFPLEGARCGLHTQPAIEHPDWPPPLNARSPVGYVGAIHLLQRYDIETLPGVNTSYDDGTLLLEGNKNDVYEFYMSAWQYPNLYPTKVWDPGYVVLEPDASQTPLPLGGWASQEGAPAKRGVVENQCSRSEDFVATGEYRLPWVYDPSDPPLVQAQKYWMWYGGDWPSDQGFYWSPYQARGVPQDDFGIWFGSYRLGESFEFAIPAGGVRIHSFQWVVRWSVFTFAKGTLTGRQTGEARAFSDG